MNSSKAGLHRLLARLTRAFARRAGLLPGLLPVLLPVSLLCACGSDPALRRGHDALGQGRYPEAIAAFEDARSRLPADQHPTAALASAHRALAAQTLAASALTAAHCADARRHLAQAEALDRRVLLVDHQLLQACAAAHDPDPAQRIADLEALVALGDQRLEPRHTLMRLLIEAGRDADALAQVPTLERAYGLTLDDHRQLVGAWERTERPAAARPHVEKLLQADPRDLLARLKLAELDEAAGDLDAAERTYRALVVDHPQNPVICLRLAQFLDRRGDAAGARAMYHRANALRGIETGVSPKRPLRKSRR